MSDKRPITARYIFFYVIFLPDTWQILIGVLAAYLLTPVVISPDLGLSAKVVLYFMMATIGYAGARVPARAITRMLKKWILGDRAP